MVKATLVEVLGQGATQTATTLTILKADLPRLTPSANNTPESLLIGILLKAQSNLTQESFDSNLDQSLTILKGYSSSVTRGTQNVDYRTKQLVVSMSALDTDTEVDPDNY
ncbi:hypothetical protein CDG76_30685 [Nostoc sp. 'Peltigera membranacea cyanobiont' 210A]|uniref:hypothetical protein n=1 Tax=Nostoc sp. 'Peltigera membranacea cyanobiont' 210A TaxID=2014529 RepID=UPI000B95AC4E|nr:hypothetical protein [Nostoc sp. 'Peltigera membranacea cyanobiont' 210A]OYD90593.1 hypothetical protein CDG76_30685 [Nostoc sp. 'Peltigera membranacea cyanobiont' 210A]